MASKLLPEIQGALSSLDDSMMLLLPELQKLPLDERIRQSVAFSTGLCMRLVTFGLGPVGQLHPDQIEMTTLAIMETIREIESDLWPKKNTSDASKN